jgi:hypothetical protein
MGGTRKHYVAVGSGVEPMVVLFQFMGKGHALFAYTTKARSFVVENPITSLS